MIFSPPAARKMKVSPSARLTKKNERQKSSRNEPTLLNCSIPRPKKRLKTARLSVTICSFKADSEGTRSAMHCLLPIRIMKPPTLPILRLGKKKACLCRRAKRQSPCLNREMRSHVRTARQASRSMSRGCLMFRKPTAGVIIHEENRTNAEC